MNKKTRNILIGVGVVALGIYLYQRNKKKNANGSTTPIGDGEENSEFRGGFARARSIPRGSSRIKQDPCANIGRVYCPATNSCLTERDCQHQMKKR